MTNDLVKKESGKPERKKYVLKKRETTKSSYKIDYESELNPAQLSAVEVKENWKSASGDSSGMDLPYTVCCRVPFFTKKKKTKNKSHHCKS